MNVKIGVIGLGYVGLPVAISFASKFPCVVGFDIDKKKVDELLSGYDRTGEIDKYDLRKSSLKITSSIEDLSGVNFFVIAVPTPIDRYNRPDLKAVVGASEIVGKVIRPGAIVVYESTVYPGVTEDICGPVLERVSGLKRGVDFKLGYSPERINPGDKNHTIKSVVKVVSGEDDETLKTVAKIYSVIVDAGVHLAPSIKVAEAAKVIENTQRDLNIALMNELSIIFNMMGIRTVDVLEAAGTKWNFLPFRPGLVGGHCIGVDPYYLTTKAEELGYHPQIISAGRRINDGMGKYIAEQTVKMMIRNGITVLGSRVGVFGLTFKENVRDMRNSRVPDIIRELREYGVEVLVHDPIGDHEEAIRGYGVELCELDQLVGLNAIVLAVAHKQYLDMNISSWVSRIEEGKGVIIDVKSIFKPDLILENIKYWSL